MIYPFASDYDEIYVGGYSYPAVWHGGHETRDDGDGTGTSYRPTDGDAQLISLDSWESKEAFITGCGISCMMTLHNEYLVIFI